MAAVVRLLTFVDIRDDDEGVGGLQRHSQAESCANRVTSKEHRRHPDNSPRRDAKTLTVRECSRARVAARRARLRHRPYGDDPVAFALHERDVEWAGRDCAGGASVLSRYERWALAHAGNAAHFRFEDRRPPPRLDGDAQVKGNFGRSSDGRRRSESPGLADCRVRKRAVVDPGDARAADDRVDDLAAVLAGERAAVPAAPRAPTGGILNRAADSRLDAARYAAMERPRRSVIVSATTGAKTEMTATRHTSTTRDSGVVRAIRLFRPPSKDTGSGAHQNARARVSAIRPSLCRSPDATRRG